MRVAWAVAVSCLMACSAPSNPDGGAGGGAAGSGGGAGSAGGAGGGGGAPMDGGSYLDADSSAGSGANNVITMFRADPNSVTGSFVSNRSQGGFNGQDVSMGQAQLTMKFNGDPLSRTTYAFGTDPLIGGGAMGAAWLHYTENTTGGPKGWTTTGGSLTIDSATSSVVTFRFTATVTATVDASNRATGSFTLTGTGRCENFQRF